MTVGKQLHQTLASLRGCKADMETYALSTDNKNAQKLFSDSAKQLEQIVCNFKDRVNYVEQQEPQYNVKKDQQNQQQKS